MIIQNSKLPETIRETHDGLINYQYTALELLGRTEKEIAGRDPDIHAFLSQSMESARAAALEVDRNIAAGEPIGMLAGVPCAVKDNILIEGEPCTAASKMLEQYRSAYDATVIKKLKKTGAVVMGKTNMDEFAMGSSTENSAFGPTKNPHDLTRVPGGSSGGSAAAVAAGMAVYALGSDTGGSIRQPAGFCGVVGLKPTYGTVSRYGLIAMASSLDVIGPLANTVEDVQTVFETIRGADPMDATSVGSNGQRATGNRQGGVKGMRIGLPKEYFIQGMEQDVETAVRNAAKKFEALGAHMEEVSLPHSPSALAAYYVIMPAEASANLARFDGMRYGEVKTKNEKAKTLLDTYCQNRALLGPEVRRRIMLGTYVLSHGYYDAYYKKALQVRALIKRDFEEAFEKVDVLLAPVTPTLPFRLGEKTDNPLTMYLEDIFTVSMNLAGVPALAMNCGHAERDGVSLPIGMQLVAPWFGEEQLFAAGKAFEAAG